MIAAMARNWWALAIRGAVAIVFGLLAFIWPGLTIAVLVSLFGAFIFIDGVLAVVAAVQSRSEQSRWWALLLEGIAGIVAGLLTWLWPGITLLLLVYFAAAWALVTGLMELIAAFRLRAEIEGEWRLALARALSIVFAILLAVWPLAGALAAAWLIGAYAIIFGIVLLLLAFRLKGLAGHRASGPAVA
jgi:uncharacterized membrane protein HdeD (DUF308 family)